MTSPNQNIGGCVAGIPGGVDASGKVAAELCGRQKWADNCDRVFPRVCVCLLVTAVCLAKTDEPIEMRYWLWSHWSPMNHVLDGARIRPS